jgi:hypothetical protein
MSRHGYLVLARNFGDLEFARAIRGGNGYNKPAGVLDGGA